MKNLAVLCVVVVLSGCNTHFSHTPTFTTGPFQSQALVNTVMGLVLSDTTRQQTFEENPYLGYSATLVTGPMLEQMINAVIKPVFSQSRIVTDPGETPLAIEVTYSDIVYDQPGLVGLRIQVETQVSFYRGGRIIAQTRERSGTYPFSNQYISYAELERRLSASLSNATGASVSQGLITILDNPEVRRALAETVSNDDLSAITAQLSQVSMAYVANQAPLSSGASAANSLLGQQVLGAFGAGLAAGQQQQTSRAAPAVSPQAPSAASPQANRTNNSGPSTGARAICPAQAQALVNANRNLRQCHDKWTGYCSVDRLYAFANRLKNDLGELDYALRDSREIEKTMTQTFPHHYSAGDKQAARAARAWMECVAMS